MTRRNRLDPFGALHAIPDRGTMWGNRGALLGADGTLRRHHATKAWIVCMLEFKGWQRVQWQPGRLTELFLLDEATGLAAGHRPCGLCRHADLERFKAAWPGPDTRVAAIDAVLHDERCAPAPRGTDPGASRQRTHRAPAASLPPGVMVALDDDRATPAAGEEPTGAAAWLVTAAGWRRWTPAGYTDRRPPPRGDVDVLTPAATVATIAAGYEPGVYQR